MRTIYNFREEDYDYGQTYQKRQKLKFHRRTLMSFMEMKNFPAFSIYVLKNLRILQVEKLSVVMVPIT